MKFPKWFYEIDHKMFLAVLCLMTFGFIITMAASPAVAERISLHQFHFIQKQFVYLITSLFFIITLSGLNERSIKKLILYGFILTIFMMIAVLILSDAAKGAKRWLNFFGFSLQPSEFLKPFYNSTIAIILAKTVNKLKVFITLVGIHSIIVILLLLQPDFGMAILISTVFFIQLFIAEIPILWLLILGCIFLSGAFFVYLLFPHVAKRIEKFLSAADSEVNYQVQKSLESYYSGGLWGKGPGEGTIKYYLPDAHTDFIFPVIAEELGIIFCLFIIGLILYIIMRGFWNVIQMRYSLYRVYCIIPILSFFAIQSIFNIAVTLNLVPTKGMTLPFISYGGSSLIAQSILFGIYLNITKHTQRIGIKRNTIHARI